MKKNNIEIKFVKTWPEDEIVNLYKAGGWWKDFYDKSGIKYLIAGSFAFVVAVDINSNRAVGMGRLISDGVSDAYIQDLVVLPEYRKLGVGKNIVQALLDHCLSKNILWIGLIAEPDQDGFYSNIGFKQMSKYIPMKYETDD
jgi:GNAT superfamily N-acetyltransferase